MNYLKYIFSFVILIIIYGIVIYNTTGRYNRYEYIIKSLILIGIMVLYPILLFVPINFFKGIFGICGIVLYPYCAYQLLKTKVKRFHDLNMSGWYLVCDIIPIIDIILLFLLIFKKGVINKNQYDEPIDFEKLLKIDILDYNYQIDPPVIKKYSNNFFINNIKFIYDKKLETYVLIEELNKNTELEKLINKKFDITKDKFRIYFKLNGKQLNELVHFKEGIIIKNDEIIEKHNIDFYIKYENFKYNLLVDNEFKGNKFIKEMINKFKNKEKNKDIIFFLTKKEVTNFLRDRS